MLFELTRDVAADVRRKDGTDVLLLFSLFSVVAEEGNITRAARRLFISQPALSAMIAKLEKELGFVLFCRQSNRIELNEAGRCFYNYTNSALAILNDGLAKAQQIANRDNRTARIVSSVEFCAISRRIARA